MLEHKITKIVEAYLYTKEGKKIIDLTKVTLKNAPESLIIINKNKSNQ